jgi:hypothetical protein
MLLIIVEGVLWHTAGNTLDIIISTAGGIHIFSAIFHLLINKINWKNNDEQVLLF